MKHIFVPSLISALCIFSCAKSTDIPGDDNDTSAFAESVMDVTATIDDFVYADRTKSTFTPTPGGGTWSWKDGDQLGFWSKPMADNQIGRAVQVVFDVVESVGAGSATFRGNCYGILRGNTYYTYYPYDKTADSTKVTISYEGQNPSGNDGCANLGKFDYLYSDEYKVPASGDISFQYHHKGCIAKFIFTLPSSNIGNITKFNLSASQPTTLISEAWYNPSSNPETTTVTAYKDSLSYNLGAKSGGSYAGLSPTGNQLVVYTMMCPTDLDGKTFTATLYDNAGNVYRGTSSTLSGTQAASNIYPYEITVKNVSGVTDLSANGYANCYIVSAPGQYKFKTNMGVSETPIGNIWANPDADFPFVLWESNGTGTAPEKGDIITEVTYENNYITFRVPDNNVRGNALIAVRYSPPVKAIQWSWHIWRVDKPADQEYPNGAGSLMDRNLGALGTSGVSANGLLYQWGRKDPFMGHTIQNKSTIAPSDEMKYNGGTIGVTQLTDILSAYGSSQSYSIQNPNMFIGSATGEWQASYVNNGWQNNNTDLTRWRTSSGGKGQHDPCPPGYRVMDGTTSSLATDRDGFFSKAYDTAVKHTSTSSFWNDYTKVESDNTGLSLKLNDGNNYSYYSGSGYLTSIGTRVGTGVYVWSNSHAGFWDNELWYDNVVSGSLYVNLSGRTLQVNYGSFRSAGLPVRCQKM